VPGPDVEDVLPGPNPVAPCCGITVDSFPLDLHARKGKLLTLEQRQLPN
jgi:hypothetical protein